MVGVVFAENLLNFRVQSFGDGDPHHSFACAQGHAAVKYAVARERVQRAREFARIEVDDLAAALEVVDFLNDGQRYDDVVVLKLVDAGRIVQNDVRVQDEGLRCRASSHRQFDSLSLKC